MSEAQDDGPDADAASSEGDAPAPDGGAEETVAPDGVPSVPPADAATTELPPDPPSCVVADWSGVQLGTAPGGGHVALSARGDGALAVAWDSQGTIDLRLAGQDNTTTLIPGGGAAATSGLELVENDDGWAVFWSTGSIDDGDPDSAQIWFATIDAEGSALEDPTLVTTRQVVGPGAVLSTLGYRVWGRQETQDGIRRAALMQISPAGELLDTHHMQAESNFVYLRLHTSGVMMNVPMVRPGEDGELTYILQGVHTPGCGLPAATVASLGPGSSLVASAFSISDAIWIARDPGPSGRALFHSTIDGATTVAALPSPPPPTAEVAVADDGATLIYPLDHQLIGVPLSPLDGTVKAEAILAEGLSNSEVSGLRAVALVEGIAVVVLRAEGSRLHHVCPPNPE